MVSGSGEGIGEGEMTGTEIILVTETGSPVACSELGAQPAFMSKAIDDNQPNVFKQVSRSRSFQG